jgi:hypothetical protein
MPLFGSGHEIVTSTTRPSTPVEGQLIYETNTDCVKLWTGLDWKTLGVAGWEDKTNRVQFTWIGAINQSFVVPAGVYIIYGKVWGASGGPGQAGGWSYGGPGGGGGYGGGLIPVTPGETLTIMTGQHGYPAGSGYQTVGTRGFGGGPTSSSNGTDNRYGGGGGGFSGIFRGAPAQGTTLLMAGGGGGGGSTRATYGEGVSGGAGGGVTGEMGHSLYDQKWAYGGRAGTQTSGGGQPSSDGSNQDASGGAFYGGFARYNTYGGGGGGGYFGGGGGGYSESNTMGGGGGGSGFAHSSVINPQLLSGIGRIPANYDDPDMPREGSNTTILTALGPSGVTTVNLSYGGIGAVVIRY